MRIAVTGANSQIGQAVISACTSAGNTAIAFVRNPVQTGDRKFDLADLARADMLESADSLIHIAWDRSRNLTNAIQINYRGSAKLFDECRRRNIRPVLLSTMSAFSPRSEYGRTKLELEGYTVSISGHAIRAGLIWGGSIAGFLSTIYRLATIPVVCAHLLPDPVLYHSEISELARCLVLAATGEGNYPPVTLAISSEPLGLSDLTHSMRRTNGIHVACRVQKLYGIAKQLERLGIKLPFNADSLTPFLDQDDMDVVSALYPHVGDFIGSAQFLDWISRYRTTGTSAQGPDDIR